MPGKHEGKTILAWHDISAFEPEKGDFIYLFDKQRESVVIGMIEEVTRLDADRQEWRFRVTDRKGNPEEEFVLNRSLKITVDRRIPLFGRIVKRHSEQLRRMTYAEQNKLIVVELVRFLQNQPDMKFPFSQCVKFLQDNGWFPDDRTFANLKRRLTKIIQNNTDVLASRGGIVFWTGVNREAQGSHPGVQYKEPLTIHFPTFVEGIKLLGDALGWKWTGL